MKFSKIGLFDIIYFTKKPQIREKAIQNTKIEPLVELREVNKKAYERHPEKQELVIDQIVDHGNDTKSYILKKKDGTNPAFFRAGQYVVVRQIIDGKLIARPISISSGPSFTLDGKMAITVRKVKDGFLSKYIIDNWKVGDEVVTSGPQGTFYYEGLRDSKNVIAIAGGSGITPILSMAYALIDDDEDFNLTILYGTKNEKEILFKDEFEKIMKKTNKIKLVNVLSDEEKDGYEHGFIDAKLIKKYTKGLDSYSIFASGPQAMYNFLDKEVESLKIERKYYRKEIFGSVKDPSIYKDYPQEAKGKVFKLTVLMCDQKFEIDCRSDENIIVALERAGIAGPNRCRGGICGWCRSKLISGTVYIPEVTDGRRAADKVYNYIHPCASFATSDIVLEVPYNKL